MKKHHWTIGLGIIFVLILFAIFVARPHLVTAPEQTHIIPLSIESIKETSSTTPSVSIEYPQFTGLDKFNKTIRDAVLGRLANFRKEASENSAARLATADPKANIPDNAYSFITTWQIGQINNHYISFIIRFDSFVGGANDIQEVQTFNYDLIGQKIINLGDLFQNDSKYLATLSTQIRAQLTNTLKSEANGDIETDMLNSGTEPLAENFQNFTFNDYSITFYFPKYAVAPGSFGEQQVVIPKSAVQ